MNQAVLQPSPCERARAISGLIGEHAREGERLGRLTDDVAEALVSNRLCAIMVPREAGGLGGSRIDLFEATEEVARMDGAAAWCVAVCNGNTAFVHRAANRTLADELFGPGPVSIWASLLPKGRSEPVDGGYRMRGSFGFGSGSSMSQWVVASSPLPERGGYQWFRGHVIPKSEVQLRPESWEVMGLRATHSVDYDIDTIVPAHRTFEFPMLAEANPGGASARECIAVAQIGMVAFASGLGQAALTELLATAPRTKRLAGEGLQSEDHVVQFGIGELEGRLRAGRSWYVELLAQLDAAARGKGVAPSAEDLLQSAQTLTRAARDTALFAFDQAGTSVIHASQPLQRILRDLMAGLKHAQLTPSILGRIGKMRLGQKPDAVRFGAPQ